MSKPISYNLEISGYTWSVYRLIGEEIGWNARLHKSDPPVILHALSEHSVLVRVAEWHDARRRDGEDVDTDPDLEPV